MNQYIVKSPVKLRGKIHPIGATVEMNDETAQRALAKGSVERHNPREQARALTDAIAVSAARIVAGEATMEGAVELITTRLQGAAAGQIRAALNDSVRELRQDAERKAKAEAEQKAKEEAEQRAREEAERKAKEEADRKAKDKDAKDKKK
jgi:hypothetical protein